MCDKNVIIIEAHKDFLRAAIQQSIESILDRISREEKNREALISVKSNLSINEVNKKFNEVFDKPLMVFAEEHNITITTELKSK